MADADLVIAAGGVVVRSGADGPEVLLIHRPRYDDWTFPKGKADGTETPEETALREVREETGLETRLISPICQSRYPVYGGEKFVHWYAMRVVRQIGFEPNLEVDDVRWLSLEDARSQLSYQKEVIVLDSLSPDQTLSSGILFLVRHGSAGSRADWEGDDRLRPLSAKGERQALGIASDLAHRSIGRILTSPYVRCRQTVEPLAEKLGLEVEEFEELGEGQGFKAARNLCQQLAGTNAVLCSHGDVIPELLDWMARQGMRFESPVEYKKGSTWEIEVNGGRFDTARYLPPPD